MRQLRIGRPRQTGAVCVVALLIGYCSLVLGQDEEPKKRGKYPSLTFGTSLRLPHALRGTIYYIPVESKELPDFDKLRPVGMVYATTLNVPQQQFTAGFPGVTNRIEWFAIDYRGDFFIDKPGKYMFSLTSDDGSALYIDGKRIIDNNGTHQAVTVGGAAKLTHGLHQMRVTYFQGPRYEVALKLEVAGPKEKWRIFSMEEFCPREEPESAASAENPVQ